MNSMHLRKIRRIKELQGVVNKGLRGDELRKALNEIARLQGEITEVE